ncbi:hypothetical protein CSIV_05040 [Microbacterium sp. CSI-V]|uniref:hypothetical protein n=1 Tax=Microbacterium sp. CSI-V TaxID=1933777 RepID=UPI00097CA098|nr:hypothetical protein [Microbacterium sp. CSI-V]ONI65646.1 hypothetical protein CSIV_05040 [Microbacterium sp. CSI-V]
MSGVAQDMSSFWRIFTYQHGRISGTFVVHGGKDGAHHVKPYDVTVYADDSHSWGRVLRSDDLTAFYRNGSVEIPAHMIREGVRPDVEDVMGELVVAIAACIAAFESSAQEPTPDPVALGALSRTQDRMGWNHTNGSTA